jgi:hypothetical protein
MGADGMLYHPLFFWQFTECFQVNPIALTLPDAQMSDVVPEDSPYPPVLSPA